MSVLKRGSGAIVTHCHGKRKGKIIARHATLAGAWAQHRAIQAEKARQKKHGKK